MLCARLTRKPSAPGGNKGVAYLAVLEFSTHNDIAWVPPSVDDAVVTIERVAAGTVSEHEV